MSFHASSATAPTNRESRPQRGLQHAGGRTCGVSDDERSADSAWSSI